MPLFFSILIFPLLALSSPLFFFFPPPPQSSAARHKLSHEEEKQVRHGRTFFFFFSRRSTFLLFFPFLSSARPVRYRKRQRRTFFSSACFLPLLSRLNVCQRQFLPIQGRKTTIPFFSPLFFPFPLTVRAKLRMKTGSPLPFPFSSLPFSLSFHSFWTAEVGNVERPFLLPSRSFPLSLMVCRQV